MAELPINLEIITLTYEQIAPLGATIAERVYGTAFCGFPKFETLFANVCMTTQNQRFVESLDFVVRHADQPDTLRPFLVELGRRHVGYGVTAENYDQMGAAFLEALSQLLGPAWNDEVYEQWAKLYVTVKMYMLEGHHSALS